MKTVKLKTFSSVFEANVVKGLLENEGIPCIIHNAASHQVLPAVMVPVELLVAECDYERAREIVDTKPEVAPKPRSFWTYVLLAILIVLAFLLGLWLQS